MTKGIDSAFGTISSLEHYSAHTGASAFETFSTGGLTKREYIAARAMQGLLPQLAEGYDTRDVAADAVRLADELIEALNKEQVKA